MYWWRASIQDCQAFTSASWWRHSSETVFRDNFVIFRSWSKRIAFWNQWIVLRVLGLYANLEFSWWLRDHFSAPFRDLYLPNASWSQTLQTSKMHTVRVSAFIGTTGLGYITLSRRLYVVEGYHKNAKKNAVLDLAPPMLQNFGIYHDSTRPHLHLDGLPPKSRRSVLWST